MPMYRSAPRRFAAAIAAVPLAAAGLFVASPPQIAGADPLDPADGITRAENPRVPEGAVWYEQYFDSPVASNDGSAVELHADVIRPADIPADQQTPVILSVGPYFAHAGQTSVEQSATGPSERFNDLIEGADLMDRGYTFVMVDLRGFGGSSGCLDWAGPGEQADVKAAVEWAADQEWSNGKVGMYGKSYDAVTGLIGANLQPEGLEAVIAQEPVWNMYNYLYSNNVPRPNQIYTPSAYNSIASIPGFPEDSQRYRDNAAYTGTPAGACYETNSREPAENTSLDTAYWQARDLAAQAQGSTVPLFVTQGFIETNTKPEDMDTYLANHAGPQRGWLGQWNHVRGNDLDDPDDPNSPLAMGREGWFDEVMSFYDEYLQGVEPTVDYPNFLIQDSDGNRRGQETWPGKARTVSVSLGGGRYLDDGVAQGPAPDRTQADQTQADQRQADQRQADRGRSGEGAAREGDMEYVERTPPGLRKDRDKRGGPRHGEVGQNYATFSDPVRSEVRLTGTPAINLKTKGERNVMVRLWDVSPDGTAVMINENVAVLEADGRTRFDLKSMEWTLHRGDSLAVTIGTLTDGYWWPEPSGQQVTVQSAKLDLALQSTADDVAAEGERAPFLDRYIAAYTADEPMTPPAKGRFRLALPGK
ncbi:CocE/NonD family hydrolase [Naumannella huperziae]